MARAPKDARTFDAMPDTVDFRDQMYVPTLVEVAQESDLQAYRDLGVPILDQGKEGACTGFGLATVANYLLRRRRMRPDANQVSPRMLYLMARRYDEWPGEDYEGSSARGAMKAWHKHGVCSLAAWPDAAKFSDLDQDLAVDAAHRPLGAYFRVNHKELVAIHSAISEVGVLYATGRVHQGWMDVKTGDKQIVYSDKLVGGHAFAIVGYDEEGFWIQNSWGPTWGDGGLAHLGYGDWLENGTDIWAARLGVPVDLQNYAAAAQMRAGSSRSQESALYVNLRPHVVTADNDGTLRSTGVYGLTPPALKDIVRTQLPATVANWPTRRVLVYAHGGLVAESDALQYAANHVQDCLAAQVYPLSVIWRSDAWTTITDILQDAFARRRDTGVLDSAKDFMLDRLDDTLEVLARTLGGKALWDEMKENATLAASRAKGAAQMVAAHLVAAKAAGEIDEIHLAGHSAGAVMHAPLAQYLVAQGVKIESLSLWAPACTLDLFNSAYLPLIKSGDIEAFDLYTLDDATEQDDDCKHIYNKSLLYLVSAAFEARARIPVIRSIGTPLLGMARDVEKGIPKSFWAANKRWIIAPGSADSKARHHGDFDNDVATLTSTLARITGQKPASQAPAGVTFRPPVGKMQRARLGLEQTFVRRPRG